MKVSLSSQGVFVNGVKQTGLKAVLYGLLVLTAGAIFIFAAWCFFSLFLFILPFIIGIVLLVTVGSLVKNLFSRKNTRTRNRRR